MAHDSGRQCPGWRCSARKNSPPAQKSITKYRQFTLWNDQCSVTMNGWFDDDRISRSVCTRFTFLRSTISFLGSTFIA